MPNESLALNIAAKNGLEQATQFLKTLGEKMGREEKKLLAHFEYLLHLKEESNFIQKLWYTITGTAPWDFSH